MIDIPECVLVDESKGYSAEKNIDGSYTLYFGRGDFSHGYNLCNISDIAANCDIDRLVELLNAGIAKEPQ